MFNDYTYTNVVFNDVEGIENLITLNLIGIDGDNTIKIQLSSEVTDTLILNLTAESEVCGWTFFSINSAIYNGVILTIEDFNGRISETRISKVARSDAWIKATSHVFKGTLFK